MDRPTGSYWMAALALVLVAGALVATDLTGSWWWVLLCIPGFGLALFAARKRRRAGLPDLGR